MTTPLSPATTTRLEKVAADNGFDEELPRQGDWLAFASTRAPLHLWLTAVGDAYFLAAVSQHCVARALAAHGTAFTNPLPSGACAARGVADIPTLHHLVRRAFQLSRTLPDELLHVYQKRVATLPQTTEAERLVVQRVGQDVFREGLLEYWEGRCAITRLAVPELLRASHIKPWADCDSDDERLHIFNGLLLAPHLDAVFDRGIITIEDDGAVRVSPALDAQSQRQLGVDAGMRVRGELDGHREFLEWHRTRVFRRGGAHS